VADIGSMEDISCDIAVDYASYYNNITEPQRTRRKKKVVTDQEGNRRKTEKF
jgi:hypothetical protein